MSIGHKERDELIRKLELLQARERERRILEEKILVCNLILTASFLVVMLKEGNIYSFTSFDGWYLYAMGF